MSILGISSALSSYRTSESSVYGLSPLSSVKDKQENSSAQNLTKDDDINDEAIISDEAKSLLASEESNASDNEQTKSEDKASQLKEELTSEEKQQVSELKTRDAEVRAHEQAHMAAAAGISASAPSYDYEMGPDGKRYAVGGEVNISFNESGNPSSDIVKAQTMKNAALAPAQPSGQDLAVARHADSLIAQFKEKLSQQNAENLNMIKGTENIPQPINSSEASTNGQPVNYLK